MFKSVNDARFTMWATVLPRLDRTAANNGVQPTGAGKFVRQQDPDSLQIVTVWQPDANQANPAADSIEAQYEIPCYARGYTDLGYRSSANREVFVQGEYNVLLSIQFDYPAWVTLNHQSIVTNIRMSQDVGVGDWVWTYEDDVTMPVAWECQGTTPVNDPFGKLLRFTTVLKRSEIQ